MLSRSRPPASLLLCICVAFLAAACAPAQTAYLGFDRNDYPGDAALAALRQTFRYTGYWLNNPPGATHNTWAGKRALLKQRGFGFLVLFNGRLYAQLKGKDATALGAADGRAATAAAAREGFPAKVLIFLDLEEGGRLLAEQAAYVSAWVEAVQQAGMRAGVYCSGIEVTDSSGRVSTANDIARRLAPAHRGGRVALWVANDACPPAPGCTLKPPPLRALDFPLEPAAVSAWQYAQSPRRRQFSGACPQNQAPDGNCYAPGLPPGPDSFIDLNVARSPDPSEQP
ncbi:MAG: glycoside hydrolase domain-containing protein [Acidobacteriota bacterium]